VQVDREVGTRDGRRQGLEGRHGRQLVHRTAEQREVPQTGRGGEDEPSSGPGAPQRAQRGNGREEVPQAQRTQDQHRLHSEAP
jgi:hypothetical protein